MPLFLPTLAAALGAALAWRAYAARRLERATGARLRVGADGVIPGAGPIDLGSPHAPCGVLLLHGFGDSPHTLRYLAQALHARGYAVAAPLLPGHGRTLREFAASRGDDWLGAAREALGAMRARHRRVGIVGLSMGGALASVLAADSAHVGALVLIAPYLDVPRALRRLVRHAAAVEAVTRYVRGGSERSIHDEVERAQSLAYRVSSPRLLRELTGVADLARELLPRVTTPTLIVQSCEDNRVAPAVAETALGRLGAADKRLEWLEGCGHVVTVDYQRERVFALVGSWLDRHLRVEQGEASKK